MSFIKAETIDLYSLEPCIIEMNPVIFFGILETSQTINNSDSFDFLIRIHFVTFASASGKI